MHTSEITKGRAQANIQLKVDVLCQWVKHIPWRAALDGSPLRDERGELVLDFYPSNAAAFATWDGSQNCSFVRQKYKLYFKRTSRDTLGPENDRREGPAKQIDELFGTLNQRAHKQLAHANKLDMITKLLTERSYHRQLIKQQELDIALSDTRAVALQNKLVRLDKTRELNEAELQEKIKVLESRNAELTRSLSKLINLSSKTKI